MNSSKLLQGKVVVVTGASRGIGRAIAIACASQGARVAVLAKTSEPHPKLSGTIHSVVKEITDQGGEAKAFMVDVRDDELVEQTINTIADEWSGIDALINNASALQITRTLDTPMKRFDLMFGVNVRGTFAASRACIPWLKNSKNPHIINVSPPLSLNDKWFKNQLVYTMSKYGMSMCTLGMAAEFRADGIAVNSLWPKYIIATAAIEAHFPKEILPRCRKPQIMADAVCYLLNKKNCEITGQFLFDEQVLTMHGVTDLTSYANDPNVPLYLDLYID